MVIYSRERRRRGGPSKDYEGEAMRSRRVSCKKAVKLIRAAGEKAGYAPESVEVMVAGVTKDGRYLTGGFRGWTDKGLMRVDCPLMHLVEFVPNVNDDDARNFYRVFDRGTLSLSKSFFGRKLTEYS